MKENVKPGYFPGLIKLPLCLLFFYFFTTLQGQGIYGTVSDESGKKSSGVSVTEKGPFAGPSTDASSQFTGYSDQLFSPKYDALQVIYTDIIKELTKAAPSLNASSSIETSDVLYTGNITNGKSLHSHYS